MVPLPYLHCISFLLPLYFSADIDSGFLDSLEQELKFYKQEKGKQVDSKDSQTQWIWSLCLEHTSINSMRLFCLGFHDWDACYVATVFLKSERVDMLVSHHIFSLYSSLKIDDIQNNLSGANN